MNWTRIALIGFVATAALAAWPRHETIIDTHGPTRRFVIRSTLARSESPVVVLGDSIVEASTLPRSFCGHPVVNAGIGGMSTAGNLGAMTSESLGGRQAALIVVALGTNDATIPNSDETFRSNYRELLTELAALTPVVAIAAIPGPEAGFDQAKKLNFAAIDRYNAILPELAKDQRAKYIPLPAMPPQHTIDGIHLNAVGYEVWDGAILGGIESVLCKPS
jgi:hypothetical protein